MGMVSDRGVQLIVTVERGGTTLINHIMVVNEVVEVVVVVGWRERYV